MSIRHILAVFGTVLWSSACESSTTENGDGDAGHAEPGGAGRASGGAGNESGASAEAGRAGSGAGGVPDAGASEAGGAPTGTIGAGGSTHVDPPPGPAPAWFKSAADGEWIAVAGEGKSTIRGVLPSPVPHLDGFPDNPGSITGAWTGGGVDQSRGELLLVANGGHADYPGNEGYALSLREEHPAWRRLSDPTPNSMLEAGPATPLGAFNADGRPRAMHSTFECFGDGRMWFAYQNSYTSGAGDSTSACFSYDRGYQGMPDVGQAPLAWTADNLGPWTVHPNPKANWTNGFGKAAWDRVGHKVWGLGGNNNVNAPQYWSVDTTGATLGSSRLYSRGGSLDNFNSWVVVAHDLRILVAGGSYFGKIFVFEMDRAGQPDDWQEAANVSGTGFFESGSGGAYVIANHAIAIANPKNTHNGIYKLQIPVKAAGGHDVYDAGGTWKWGRLDPGGAKVSFPSGGNNDTNTKWNIVEDMGNTQSAIVVATSIEGPTYVYKIPLAGL